MEKFSHFLALSINIPKTVAVADRAKVTRKLLMSFRLTPRSMTLDNDELLYG